MLYDQLVKDLRKAGIAMRDRRYEAIAAEVKHSLIVIQQLEGSLKRDTGEEVVPWLLRFYGILRENILSAQIKCSTEKLDEVIALVMDVRSAWQDLETKNNTAEFNLAGTPSPSMDRPAFRSDEEVVRSNWSA